jgi:hypothetical protein
MISRHHQANVPPTILMRAYTALLADAISRVWTFTKMLFLLGLIVSVVLAFWLEPRGATRHVIFDFIAAGYLAWKLGPLSHVEFRR